MHEQGAKDCVGFCALSVPARGQYHSFFFLPGLIPARAFRAREMSLAVQSRTLTPPTFTSGGTAKVRFLTCFCNVRRATPSFAAASRVEYFISIPVYHIRRCKLRCKLAPKHAE
jgi:hypothetical protein